MKSLFDSNKTLVLNMSGTILVKGIALLIQLALLPAYMRYFDDEAVLGVWLTLVGMLSWVLTFDLGIGHGLRNKLTESLANNDWESAQKYTSSAYFVLSIAAFVLAAACLVLTRLVNWNLFFNISTNVIEKSLLTKAVRIVLIGVVINFLLHLISSVLYAFQVSSVVNLLAVFQNILLVAYLYTGSRGDIVNNLLALAWVNVICMNIPPLLATIFMFSTKLKKIRPRIKSISKFHAKDTLQLGVAFLYLQIIGIIVTQNEIFVTQFYSPQDVVEFQAYNKLFGFIVSLFSLLMTPLWSAITKAITQNRFSWVIKLFKYVCLLVIGTTILFFLVIPFLETILNLWLGLNAPTFNINYAVIMAFYGVMQICYFAWSTISFGMSLMKPNIIIITLAAILKIPLIFIFALFVPNWTAIGIAHVVTLLPYAIIFPIVMYRSLQKMKHENNM